MPKLAANLSLLFPELPFLERFAAAARAGFRYVEYQFPYDWRADDVARRASAAGVQVVLHNLVSGDTARGERGIACLPERRAEFRAGVTRAIDYARAAGCVQLNCLAGIERLLPRIGHMQLADVPDRHEPGTGEINFPWLLAHIDRLGYAGWVGCEYNPQSDTVAGLAWAKPYL
jgi:hydroxypyruvate isomerase